MSREGIVVSIKGSRIKADAVIVRGLGVAPSIEQLMRRIGVLEALRLNGCFVINKPLSMLLARDKWFSLLTLYSAGLPVPRTIITENPYTSMRVINRYKKAVFKPIIGSLGLGSAYVEDPDIAYQLTKSLLSAKQPSYIQEYIDKPGYDIRVFVVGDHVVAAMKRVITKGWKTNIAQGAKGVALKEKDDPEAFELALKAAKLLQLDYTGVDIIVDKEGRHYIIETNASPLWKGLMDATGVNPAEHIIDYIIQKCRK